MIRPLIPQPFVGRSADLDAIAALIDGAHRLVTVTGPPGVGKTSVAAALFARFSRARAGAERDAYPDVLFRDASAVHDDDRLADMIRTWSAAVALGPALLILDGFDHLVDGSAQRLSDWLRSAPHLRLLVTSRASLQISGEQVYPLAPLREPGAGVELLIARHRLNTPDFAPGAEELQALARIVERVEGIPLALELAASRLRALSPTQLSARLGDQLAVLRTRSRDVRPTHRSLEAAITGSWDALAPDSKAALAACCVFAGEFSVPAAEAVSGGALLDAVEDLQERSLLFSPAPGRLRMYDMVREFVRPRIESRDWARWAARHRTDLARRAADERAAIERGDDAVIHIERVRASRPDFLHALEHALDAGGVTEEVAEIALALNYDFSGEPTHLVDRLHAVAPDDLSLAARAKLALARVGHPSRRAAGATAIVRPILDHPDVERLDPALVLALAWCATRSRTADSTPNEPAVVERLERAADDPQAGAIARFCAHRGLGRHARARRDYLTSVSHYEAAYEIARIHKLTALRAIAAVVLASVRVDAAQTALAKVAADEANATAEALGLLEVRYTALSVTAAYHLERGEADAAARDFRAMTELAARIQQAHWRSVPAIYASMADLEAGHVERALRDLEALRALATSPRTHLNGLADAFAALAARTLGRSEVAHHRLARARHDAGESVDERITIGLVALWVESEGPLHDASIDAYLTDIANPNFEQRAVIRILRAQAAGTRPVVRPLRLLDGGKRVEMPSGETVDLSRRKLLRALLGALAAARVERPGEPMSLEALAAVGWPESRLRVDVIKNRLYVAMTRLRDAGLRDYVETTPEGWRIPPDLPVEQPIVNL